jgi:hypothetical protein
MDSEELNIAVANEAFAENKVYMLEKQLKQANERIKRLEEAGDALANTQTYDLLETVNWRKSKEAKP